MKYYFLLIILAISSNSFGQNVIIGDWKVVSIDNGEIYYHFRKDSILVSPEFSKIELSSTRLKELKAMMKFRYGDAKFSFDKLGNCKWMLVMPIENFGKFRFKEQEKILFWKGRIHSEKLL